MFLLILGGHSLIAQVPRNIKLLEADVNRSVLACADQDAGTITLGGFLGNSNDINLTLMYLCEGDRINIDHDLNSEDLSGDPIPATTPGIGYAFYTCAPTVSGPDITTIITDPCLLINPVPVSGIWIAQGSTPDGDMLFQNTGAAQDFANSGSPVLLHFAPITIDDFGALASESGGPCTNVRTDQEFGIVYLNEIMIDDFTNNSTAGCGASFAINGGLPEYDNSNYTIEITLASDPSVLATVINSNVTHNGIVNFTVPQSGVYNVSIVDGKACPYQGTVDMNTCSTLVLSASDEVANGTACVEISVQSFTNITSFQTTINWDPSVVTFDNVSNFNLTGLDLTAFGTSNVASGSITLSWFDFGGGVTLADDAVIFELCFNVGANAGVSPVFFNDSPLATTASNNSDVIGVTSNNGSVVTNNLILGTCNTPNSGALMGSLVLTPYGDGPFTYMWESVALVPTVSGNGNIANVGDIEEVLGLEDGQYSVTLVDDNGVNFVEVATVGVGPTLFVQLNSTNPSCIGVLDGEVMANALGGTVNYLYNWSTGENTATIQNLGTGNYEVTITDQTGCVRTANESIGVIPIASNLTSTDPFCTGSDDGSVMVTPLGGTSSAGDYTISWSDNTTEMAAFSTFENLDEGTYYVTISDDNNCQILDSVTLNVQNDIIVQIQRTDNLCYGDNDGFLLITPQLDVFGAGLWDFTWTGLPSVPVNLPMTTIAAGLPDGSYTLMAVNNGFPQCQFDTTFVFDPIDSISLSINSIQDASCVPGNDGNINVDVSGGTLATGNAYDFAWSNSQTAQNAINLAGGDYSLVVTDDNGCMDSIMAAVLVPIPPTIDTILSDSTLCSGSLDGTLTVEASGGSTSIILYEWSNSLTGQMISGLGAGEYYVTLTDAGGCVVIDTGYVYSPMPLTPIDIQYIEPDCAGSNTGSIGLIIGGGKAPYNFNWEDGPNGNFPIYPLIQGGMYSVEITDTNGCGPLNLNLNLPDPPVISIDFSDITDVSCFDATGADCDAIVTATAMGGTTGTGLFNYNWATSGQIDLNAANSTANGLCKGYIVVTASDANNCFTTDSVLIYSPSLLIVDLDNTDIDSVLCFGTNTGSAFVQAQGGTQDYTYQWVGGPSTQIYNNLGQGIYTVNITDAVGCTVSTQVVVEEPAELILDIDLLNTTEPTCFGYADGQIGTTFTGGNLGGHLYEWTNNVSDISFATQLLEGDYIVTITDINNCQDTAQYTLIEPDDISFVLGDIEEPLCYGQQSFIKIDTAYGGNGPDFTFSINYGPQVPLIDSISTFAGTDVPIAVYDVNGCVVESTINVTQPFEILLDLGPDIEIELGASAMIGIQSYYSEHGIDTLIWTPDYQINQTDTAFVVVNPIKSTTYTLTLFDENGCMASDDILVKIDKNRNVFIPDAFTPNNDGINDIFQVFAGVGVTKVNFMRVYNRWGELIFSQEGFEPQFNNHIGWNGTKNGKFLNQGVFVYIIEVLFNDGEVLLYRGDVTLLK